MYVTLLIRYATGKHGSDLNCIITLWWGLHDSDLNCMFYVLFVVVKIKYESPSLHLTVQRETLFPKVKSKIQNTRLECFQLKAQYMT